MTREEICANFALPYAVKNIGPLGKGLINDTFLVNGDANSGSGKFVLQKINKYVFKEPDKVMQNLVRINDHLKTKNCRSQELVRTKRGKMYFIDDGDDYWRITRYLDNTKTLFKIEDPSIAYEAARSYGKFLWDLHDLPPSEIYETIPGFHNYANRISQLKQAVHTNSAGRLKNCQKEIDMASKRFRYIHMFYDYKFPVRVIHSDTKIANILFDADSLKAKLVIDLDIAMPGSILYDYGDMIRSFTNTLEEDDPNLDAVDVDEEIFEHVTQGFVEAIMPFSHSKELTNLLLGAKIVILIQAIRNLTDYLNGDTYYKVDYEEHNLHRTQNQLALVKAVEDKEEKLNETLKRYL